MIYLQVEEYCKDCKNFEVEQETVLLGGCDTEIVCHNLKCANRNKCATLKKHLENTLKK